MKIIGKLTGAIGGIADSPKIGQPGSVAFERSLDLRSDPSEWSVNPRTERQAAGLVTDLVMWWDLACSNLYAYGNTGTVYKKDLSNTWTVDHIAPNSSGNGLVYFPEDGYLYAAQDKTIARKSDACATNGVWYDGFIESEGGEPTNNQSITFVRASSQYASIADNASLSITDDISMETYIKLTTLPATGEIQTFISKWNEQSNQRSYKFDITTSSNAFGDGRDGALTISSNTTEDPIDANCTGTAGQYTLTLTNEHASFAAVAIGDKVLIHQSRGTGCGQKQLATVQSYSGGVLTIQEALTFSPAHSATEGDANKAQVRKLKQHTNVTVNTGITYTSKAWNGFKGGIIGFIANGTSNGPGTIIATGCGFRGGAASGAAFGGEGFAGEGSAGATFRVSNATYNGNGGGGGTHNGNSTNIGIGGAGGSNGTVGRNGAGGQALGGLPGVVTSTTDLTTMTFGGGGGGGAGGGSNPAPERAGSNGGGMTFIYSATIGSSFAITNNGVDGNPVTNAVGGGAGSGGGGGAGGSNLLVTNTATLGTSLFTATGGWGYEHQNQDQYGAGAGGSGVFTIYYGSSVTGDTNPVATKIQDSTLVGGDGYVLRLLISSTGSNTEIYTQNITDIVAAGTWYRWAVTWDAPTSTANFYQNGVLLGTQTGTLTSIYNSTARFAIATSYSSAGAAENFLDAKMDDTRVWNSVRSAVELAYYNDRVLVGTETNNSAYYKFEGNVNDSQTYTTTSNLTATNTPTYSTDVPFSGITTRSDQDIAIDATGSTYTLGTSVNETATHRQTFAPTKEPIKSVALNINTVGTGNWTVVIHDALNREIATITVANAQLQTGFYEFLFASSFRPILMANYHVHVYSTVGDGKIVTSSLNDMEGTTGNTGAYFSTFFQILVNDIYHPMTQFLNFIVVGNERYVAKLEAGNIYNPHQLVLPAGYRVRCFAKWNEYLAIGVWKGDSITDTDQGKIFLWDGLNDASNTSSPNTVIDCLQGGVNSMQGAGGVLSVIAGYEGKFMNYGGVSQSSYYSGGQLQKVSQIPNLQPEEYCEVAPGAMCMWRSVMHFGATLNTNSSTVHQGIYSYGTLNANYPVSLAFDYPPSIGDQTSSMVKIGSLFASGQSLYSGWQNGNAYGIDKVSVTNDKYATATCELLISDLSKIYQLKQPLVFRADFKELTTGQIVTLKYKAERENSWRILATEDTVGAMSVIGTLDQRMKEFQLAIDVTTNGQQLTVLSLTLEAEDATEAKGIS